ncbi:MAG TPA: hypothetical protein ENL05_01535 [Candidatus Moranbacteria bacterium]|nr:hypothetical protein [Candidatus Moranbacteria bacterium]
MDKEKKEKEEKKENGKENNVWKNIFQNFFLGIISRTENNLSNKIVETENRVLEKARQRINNLKKEIVGTLFIVLGIILVLACLIIYINTLVNNESQWVGYGIAGVITLLIGYFIIKSEK